MRLPTFKRFALWSIPCASLIGICLSFIKWGDHTGAHGLYGQGFPIPSVLWDNPPRYEGRFVDYINPLALIEKPDCNLSMRPPRVWIIESRLCVAIKVLD